MELTKITKVIVSVVIIGVCYFCISQHYSYRWLAFLVAMVFSVVFSANLGGLISKNQNKIN